LANEALFEGRKAKDTKKSETERERRSYVEALGWSSHLEEECFNSFNDPITRIPQWLKEASLVPARLSDRAEMSPLAQGGQQGEGYDGVPGIGRGLQRTWVGRCTMLQEGGAVNMYSTYGEATT
jgi:hypothetical protein